MGTVVHELSRVGVLNVRGLETYRQAEGLVLRAAPQKFNRLLTHDLRKMLVVAVFILAFVGVALSGTTTLEVEFIAGEILPFADAIFSDKSGPVSRSAEQHRIGLCQRFRREAGRKVLDSVPAYPLAGKNAGATARTNRSGDEGVCEPHAVFCHIVDVRRIDIRIARTADGVPSMVIGQQENDVGPGFCTGTTPDKLTFTPSQRQCCCQRTAGHQIKELPSI